MKKVIYLVLILFIVSGCSSKVIQKEDPLNLFNDKPPVMVEGGLEEDIVDNPLTIKIPGFKRYFRSENEIEFSLLFPNNNLPEEPIRRSLDLGDQIVTVYQAHRIFGDVNEGEYIQYNIFLGDIKAGKILSKESREAYFKGYIEGRLILNNGKIISEEQIKFRDIESLKFVYSDIMNNTTMTHKGLLSIIKGQPVSLTVVYPQSNEGKVDIYFEEFINSSMIR